jgi:exonuclease III
MNSHHKRNILHDLVIDNKIDLLTVQETKKKEFSTRMLKVVSSKLNVWIQLPSVGLSGGIVVGCDSAKFMIERSILGKFSVTLMIKNRFDNVNWTFTTVYGPVDTSVKEQFWQELRDIKAISYAAWLICGDFNAIRFRNEKSGPRFNVRASSTFNKFLDDYNLIEYELFSRKFTWSNGRQSALLDRFICSMQWDSLYAKCVVQDLASYGSDHCPLVLHTNMKNLHTAIIFRFDNLWLDIPEFQDLVIKWWQDFKLSGDIAKEWHEKMKYMRRKMKGWSKNFFAEKKKRKQIALNTLHHLDRIKDYRELSEIEAETWVFTKHSLDTLYLEEEKY